MRGTVRSLLTTTMAASALVLTGCAGAAGVVGQVGDAGYIAGDGIVTEIAPEERTAPGSFAGPLASGGDGDDTNAPGASSDGGSGHTRTFARVGVVGRGRHK